MIEVKIPASALAQIDMANKQHKYAAMLALTRTAMNVKKDLVAAMETTLDRPTKWTLNSLYVKPATKTSMQAHVWVKDTKGGGKTVPPSNFLFPQIFGGDRKMKRFERALAHNGFLPAGFMVMPSKDLALDEHGNMTRGLFNQIISQLKTKSLKSLAASGNKKALNKAIKQQVKYGGRYFVINPGGKTQPGIYHRELMGNGITPVLIFGRPAKYKKRFPFEDESKKSIQENFSPNFNAALTEALAKAFG